MKIGLLKNQGLYKKSLFPCVIVFKHIKRHVGINIVISVNRISVVWSCL